MSQRVRRFGQIGAVASAAALLVSMVATAPPVQAAHVSRTQRVSTASDGSQGNGDSFMSDDLRSVSADGRYVAFASAATNLVPNDTNGLTDVFVKDRVTGAVDRVSVDSSGNQATGGASLDPSISADGRYVAFDSAATNLVSGDTNGSRDVFVRDRVGGTTTRVSVDANGNQATGGDSFGPVITPDGRFVAFSSSATNLVPNDTNGLQDVFVKDRVTGAVERVSVDSNGNQGNGTSELPSISPDGRYVAFDSGATNLVSGDTNGSYDVFVRDRVAGTTTRVSVDANGNQATGGDSTVPSINATGTVVAFRSAATNLVPGDTNATADIFVRDLAKGTTERANLDSSGNQATGGASGEPTVSIDGRYVAFSSSATNLVPGDTNGKSDVFLRDRIAGRTVMLSVGSLGNGDSTSPAVNANASITGFDSVATNLVPNDTNGKSDVFVRLATTTGYATFARDGGVFTHGDQGFFGSEGAIKLNSPVVGGALTPTGNGYDMFAADGGVFTHGDAGFYGSEGAVKLNSPVVGGDLTPSGKGYVLFAADGGVFTHGDAGFYGSEGAIKLNQPIVGGAMTPSGRGYVLFAADGGVFTHGDARFFGSEGAIKLNKPIVSGALSPTGEGYAMFASDGGVFTHGDAEYLGSEGATPLNQPVVGGDLKRGDA